jgi:hypothetical protein
MNTQLINNTYIPQPQCNKKVTFAVNNFYNILDNLYLSDQIASFDENLIKKNNIHYLFNFTKTTPFLFTCTSNYHIKFMNNTTTYSENELIDKIDTTVQHIFKILLNKKGVLLYCEDGCNKSSIILLCFLIKYYNSNEILDLENAINFIKWKTNIKSYSPANLYIVKLYRDYLVRCNFDKQYSSDSSNTSTSTISTGESEQIKLYKKSKIVGIIKNHFNRKT